MKIALALDNFASIQKKDIISFIERCEPYIDTVKIGLELFVRFGPKAIQFIESKEVFLDLKLHDIPNTVTRAVCEAEKHGVSYLTIHSACGKTAIEAARKEANNVKLLVVSHLTSDKNDFISSTMNFAEKYHITKNVKNPGIVAPVNLVKQIKESHPDTFIVSPGIRPYGLINNDDQKSTATPKEAHKAGADMIVLGRAVTLSLEPEKVLETVQEYRDK